MAQRRVKLSWQEALGPETPAPSQDKKPSPRPKSRGKKTDAKRKKRHPNDVKTEQDMDAIAGFDASSSDELDAEIDTFGGAGFVLVDLENEMEELALVATEEGFANIRMGSKPKKNNNKKKKNEKRLEQEVKNVTAKEEKDMKKKEKKIRQAHKLLEMEEEKEEKEVVAGVEKGKKQKKKSKKEKKGKQDTAIADKQESGKVGTTPALKQKAGKNTKKEEKTAPSRGDAKGDDAAQSAKKKKEKKKKGSENQAAELEEKDAPPSKSGADGHSKKSSKDARGNGQATYSEYLDRDVVIRGLEMGGLLQGKLRVNAMYRMDGYVTVDGLSMDVLVKGMQDRNRAFDGDLVAVRLHPESEWKPMNDENGKRSVGSAASKPISSTAGVNQTALHSLWLPSVQTDQCFFKRPPDEESSVDMLKQCMARLNERIKESRCRPTATVVFILAQGNANGFIGSLEAKTRVKDLNSPLSSNDNYAYFNADDLRLPRHIRIPRLQLPDEFISRPLLYSKTMLCFCRIKAWSTRHQSPMGEFVKTVGEYTGIETGISAILSKHGLQSHTLDFDSSILDELDEKYGTSGEKWEVPEDELRKRRDFRQTQIFSIDPYNARDLDDALHIRALNDACTKFEIGVHIADVTHFIEHNSLLDREARSRATSVYLANRVLPMLPRILCEKLCSLQPQVDRLAFSVVWQMNLDGSLVDGVEPWFGKSIIRSCCKLDYGSAQKMLDGVISSDNVDEWEADRRPIPGANPNITNATVIQSVKDLWSIGENRRAMRFDTGAVSLNDVKMVFSLDAKGNPTRYGSYELKDSNRLVEEYMLLANYLVAQQLLRAHGPLAFLRHHPPPITRSLDLALEQLGKSDIKVDGRSTKQLTESLERVRQDCGETTFVIAQALIIKPMKPAEYMVAGNGASPDSWRHYALNIPYYTHFTSPIRRYADVVVHRLLQVSVMGAASSDSPVPENENSGSRIVEFTSVAQNCNEKKMTSKNAEKECDKVFLCAYVQNHGDVEVTGVVLSMGQKSFTVYVLELGLEQRLFLQELQMRGSWNEKTSQLSIRLPVAQVAVEKATEVDDENGNQDAKSKNTTSKPQSDMIKLTFMKQLRMRMSTTKKMPLALTFSVIGEKS
ncbi:DIS3-like exonuclease 2 [Phytophthora fragariae]|nr:DIS3-like exonuclease 2 [Phytophthora fragariae]KAE8929213.1 DIS3-like exonuclease 2 [Phytophthora fragariae]KAE8990477.1 DIS3-like exonuclease 2 [Phytophthora fragariae]KAE9088825.1 DIS3-like exonuclease 2 [Phytophthora fragariae]KAE9117678.1 DIS3-like exonuclease 2 [Phytophthora fragariae]